MSTNVTGTAETRKRSIPRDLTARKTTTLTGGILYNGHAGLGANAVSAGARAETLGASGIVTDNKDPDKLM